MSQVVKPQAARGVLGDVRECLPLGRKLPVLCRSRAIWLNRLPGAS
jgi:hypothetical protein